MVDKEKVKEYNRRYYLKHKEQENERSKKYRESHKEKMKELNKRWYENHKEYSREYDAKGYSEHRYKHKLEMGYSAIHQRTQKLIKKLGIRPKACPICGYEGKIEAHHKDYSKRNEIVFCCVSCHQLIHHGEIQCPKPIIL